MDGGSYKLEEEAKSWMKECDSRMEEVRGRLEEATAGCAKLNGDDDVSHRQ